MTAKILLVDDHRPHAARELATLVAGGRHVAAMCSVAEAPELMAHHDPELLVVVLRDPASQSPWLRSTLDVDGAKILLVADDTYRDEVLALLNGGVADFVRLDRGATDLLAAVNAHVRRLQRSRPVTVLKTARLTFDLAKDEVRRGGVAVSLTGMERRLLKALAQRDGAIATVQQISRQLWPEPSPHAGSSIAAYVRTLRQKLERDAEWPELLVSETGYGYRLIAEAE